MLEEVWLEPIRIRPPKWTWQGGQLVAETEGEPQAKMEREVAAAAAGLSRGRKAPNSAGGIEQARSVNHSDRWRRVR